jgi:hypothetical protein
MNRGPRTHRIGLVASGALAAALLSAGSSGATSITYDVDQTIGLGSVTGTIQTDGNTGPLGAGDITGWNLELNGVAASYGLTNSDSSVYVVGSDLTATTTHLYFDFSGSDNGYLLFQVVEFSGNNYYCNATSSAVCLQGKSVAPQSFSDPSFQNAPALGVQVIASAVPEPAAWATMLLGMAAIGGALRGRRLRVA